MVNKPPSSKSARGSLQKDLMMLLYLFMKRSEFYAPYESEPEHLRLDVPMEYSVPFEWGDLHVSETAHQSYGLLPLTSDIRDGFYPSLDVRPPRSRVFIVTPGELGTPPVPEGEAFVKPILHKKGLEVHVAMGDDKETAAKSYSQAMRDEIRRALDIEDVDDEDFDRSVKDEEGITFGEQIEQNVTQYLVHGLYQELDNRVPAALRIWLRAEHNRIFLRDISAVGVGAAALAGMFVYLGVTDHSNLDLETASGYLVAGLATTRFNVKRELQRSNRRELHFNKIAKRIGSSVAYDVHSVYCRDHFDRVWQDTIQPSEE